MYVGPLCLKKKRELELAIRVYMYRVLYVRAYLSFFFLSSLRLRAYVRTLSLAGIISWRSIAAKICYVFASVSLALY